MKRFLLIATCAFLTTALFSSCQKEEKSVVDLANELTAELQKVTDLKTAEASAPRVDALNKRFQNALARDFAMNTTALQRGCEGDPEGQEGAALLEALKNLAKQAGRVQASLPVTEYDGDIDRPRLVMAVGAANGAGDTAPASQRKGVGDAHMKGETTKNETPGNFSEYYGSTAMREALEFTTTPGTISPFQFDTEEDVIAIPETTQPAADDEAEGGDAPAATSDDSTDTTETTTDTTDTTDDSTETPSTTTSGDDDLPSLDDGGSSSGGDDDGGLDIDLDI